LAKPEWGTKRTCQNCGAHFYDLRRDPVICPVCSTVFDLERSSRARRGSTAPKLEPVSVIRSSESDDTETPDVEENVEAVAEAEVETDAESDDADDEAETSGDMNDVEAEDRDLIEDASDLGEDDDDIGEVMEHLDEDLEDKG